jgi:alpha-glucosidase (family GH31 glycosyl hydrolase)
MRPTVEINHTPLRIDIRRDGRRLIRNLRVWACEGTVHDRFIQPTEGVMPREEREFAEHAVAVAQEDDGRLALTLHGGRRAWLDVRVDDERVTFVLDAEPAPLRLALEWDERPGEAFNGLGARHAAGVDHAGADHQLGADRAYLGPHCPPELRELGGIPQGDYAPAPWISSTRGYSAWIETHGNGTRFELAHDPCLTTRAVAGPLIVHVLTDPKPAARLRRWLADVGMPALLPEWGYGFWKSRDVHEHQDVVLEDFDGCRAHRIPLDAIVIDSPWETQYNTWVPNPHQFPDFAGMVAGMRSAGVRTVVWVTPWVNLDSTGAQVPPDPGSQQLHREPASNYEGERMVKDADGDPYVARWWMGTGSPVDLLDEGAERWWSEQAKGVLRTGVEGIKADDGEGYYLPDDVRLGGTTGGRAAWALGGAYRRSMQRALDEVHPGRGVLFGRCGWTGQQATGMLWGGDQASDFWSLRILVAAAISAAASGFSNWSHDVGGYIGEAAVRRCPPELLVRWAQLGAFTPLMQAHGRMQQEPWTYDIHTLERYRGCVLLHEMLVPYIRAAAATAARCGLPIVRPLALLAPGDHAAWSVADAFGFGPALWVAPVLEDGAREREVVLPCGRWIESWSGKVVDGGREVVVAAPLERIPVWVRAGSIVVTYAAETVAAGLGEQDVAKPLVATLWGEPPLGRTAARLADGRRVAWSARHGWELPDGVTASSAGTPSSA